MAMIARPVRIAALPHARQPVTPTPMCRPGSSPAKACDKHFWWRSDAGTGHGFGKTMLLSAAKAGRTHDGGGYMPAYAKTGAVIAVLLAIGAGRACSQVKLGAVLSVTGPASFLGDPEKKTLEMYVEDINAKGGVNGQELQLVGYDDGADANAARTFATRLVEEDKVVAMIGGTTTGATLAMIPLFQEAQIPFVSLAGAIQIIEPGPPRRHRASAEGARQRRRQLVGQACGLPSMRLASNVRACHARRGIRDQ